MKSLPSVQKLSRATYWFAYGIIVSFVFPAQSAFACMIEIGTVNLPVFIIPFIIIMLAILTLTLLIWGVEKVLYRRKVNFSVFRVFILLLAIFLGIFSFFVIPEFTLMFSDFGAELPFYTKIITSAGQYLWLVACLILVLWYSLRNNPHKNIYFAVLLFFEVNLLFWILWGLYLPIYKMAGACG